MIVHCALWLFGGQWRELSAPAVLPVGSLKLMAPPPELLGTPSFSGSDECAWAA